MNKILVVDDTKDIRDMLETYLTSINMEVQTAENGRVALEILDNTFDLVILDIMMPVMDGIECLKELRKEYMTPVIFLTAKGSDMDKIKGVNQGADEYLVKPVNIVELSLKINSIIRRYKEYGGKNEVDNATVSNKIKIENILIDLDAQAVYKDNEDLKLTKTEYNILKLLVTNRGRVYNYNQILDNVNDDEYSFASANSVIVHVKNLRKKIEDDTKNPKIIKNKWGVGYLIEK